jgi:sugar phosphate isomerase/epimerase
MQPDSHPGIHLTYCSNIHPGESWEATFRQLKIHVPELKLRLSKNKPFGIGLRLSADAAEQILEPGKLDEFKSWLQKENLYVFTLNGFPYGSFHRERVKDDVYKPDWRTDERYKYTARLIDILAELTPTGSEGSISTSPVSYKYWNESEASKQSVAKKGAIHLAKLAHKMAMINETQNKDIHIDLEPEPDCLIENTPETITFFKNVLIPEGVSHLVSVFGISHEKAEQIIRTHIGVCYDTCHFALEYENPRESLTAFRDTGIRIGKVQVSAALKVTLGNSIHRKETAEYLHRFVEPVYLHQVLERREDDTIRQYRDLPDALPHIFDEHAREWRVHFHVPVFVDQFDELSSTQDDITLSMKEILSGNYSNHFEIETYTWEVLHSDLKTGLIDSIEREYLWTLEQFNK